MAHRHCDSFERRGMPAAAGSGLNRRSFLMRGAGLALSVYGGSQMLSLDGLRAGVAQAAAPSDAVIVSVFLEGGIDSLSLLAPGGACGRGGLRPEREATASRSLPRGTRRR